MTPQEISTKIQELLNNVPDLASTPLAPASYKWLGDAYALAKESGYIVITILDAPIDELMDAGTYLESTVRRKTASRKIQTILHRIIAITEIKHPA